MSFGRVFKTADRGSTISDFMRWTEAKLEDWEAKQKRIEAQAKRTRVRALVKGMPKGGRPVMRGWVVQHAASATRLTMAASLNVHPDDLKRLGCDLDVTYDCRALANGEVMLVPGEGKAFFKKNNRKAVRLRICIKTKGVDLPVPGSYGAYWQGGRLFLKAKRGAL